MESDEMRSDWFGYVCKSGETLFYYNIKTGEHRWANGLTVSEKSIFRISINDFIPKPKELCSMGTQTEDYGCINGCSSVYVVKESEKDNTMMNSGLLNDNECCYNRTRNCHETVVNLVSVENNHYPASEKIISNMENDKKIEMDEEMCSDAYHGEKREAISDYVTDSCHSRASYCDLEEDLPKNIENKDCKRQGLNNHSAMSDSCHSRATCENQEDLAMYIEDADGKESNSGYTVTETCEPRYDIEDLPKCNVGDDMQESDGYSTVTERCDNDCTMTETCEPRKCNVGNDDNMQESDGYSTVTDRCHSHGFLTDQQVVVPQMVEIHVKDKRKKNCDQQQTDVINKNKKMKDRFKHRRNGKTKKTRDNSLPNKKMKRNIVKCVETHANKNSYGCPQCNKEFDRKGKLINHLRIHAAEKPYKCSYCDKAFAQKGNLNSHLRKHTGDKPFECSYCDKAFAQKNNFNRHLRIHTDEKPYECSYCSKAFVDKCALNRHLRIHTGEKPYECSYCDQAFAHKCGQICHLRRHTGEKPYECSYCDKAFATKSALNRHLRIHTGEKPYECSYCDKAFARTSSLNNHLRTHTGERHE